MFLKIAFLVLFSLDVQASYVPIPVTASVGGTGNTSYTNGQLLIGNTSTTLLSKSTLTAGTGVTITNGAGTITVSASAGAGSGGEWVGSIVWAPTTNCSWSSTSTSSFANFATDVDCDDNSPVASGLVSLVNTGQSPAVSMSITSTSYVYSFIITGPFGDSSAGTDCLARFSDGTVNSTAGYLASFTKSDGQFQGSLTFGSTGVKTVHFQMTGDGSSATCTASPNSGLRALSINVYRFPQASSL